MFGNQFKDIVEAIGYPILLIDSQKKIKYVNRSAETFIGLSLNELKDKKCTELLTLQDEAGTVIPEYEYPTVLCLQSAKPVTKSFYTVSKDGQKRYLEISAFPSANLKNVIVTIKDITKVLQDAEQILKNKWRERLIPICAWCKKIRLGDDVWHQIEQYLTSEGFGIFTHGMCPDCAEKIFDKKIYLESYQDVCKAISSSISLNEVLNLIVTSIVKVMNVKGCMVRLLNKETEQLEVAAHYGLSDSYVNKGPVAYDKSIQDALEGKAVSVYDITSDPDSKYRQEALNEGIRTILSIPIRLKKEVIGVLRMYTAEPVKYNSEDLKFMTAIAEQAGIAITNARTFEAKLSRAKEYLRIFEEVAIAVNSTLSFNEVLKLIVSKLPEVMKLKGAAIRLFDPTETKLELVASHGLSESYLNKGPVTLKEQLRQALQKGPFIIEDVLTDPRVQYKKEAALEGVKSMMTVPVTAKGKMIGVLRLYLSEQRSFTDEDLAFLASLGVICGTAIENARMYEQLNLQSQLLKTVKTGS